MKQIVTNSYQKARHTVLGFLFILCLCLLPQSAFSKTLKTVTVELKWFHQFQFAGIYAAKEKGFYKDAGLNVIIKERNPKSSPLKDVLSGKAQFGVADSSIIYNRLKGSPVVGNVPKV